MMINQTKRLTMYVCQTFINVIMSDCESSIDAYIDLAYDGAVIPTSLLTELDYLAIRFYFEDEEGNSIPLYDYMPYPTIDVLGGSSLCDNLSYIDYGLSEEICNPSSPYYDPTTETCLFPYENEAYASSYFVLTDQNLNDFFDTSIINVPPDCIGCENDEYIDNTDLLKLHIREVPFGCNKLIYEIEYRNANGNVCFYHDAIPLRRGVEECSSVSTITEVDEDCEVPVISGMTLTITDE